MLSAVGAIGAWIDALEPRRLLATEPFISEFLASNNAGLADEDLDRPDWIEIHNPGPAMNLAGWRLVDEVDDAEPWVFPDTPVARGEYLVVFASKKNRRTPGQPLHTNFKLDAGGGYLALLRPDGTVASAYAPEYPDQLTDVSYGVATYATESLTFINTGATGRVHVPASNVLGSTWQLPGFNDAGWLQGPSGYGFEDRPTESTNYLGLIRTDVNNIMDDISQTLYIRMPFNVDDPSAVDSLLLRMKYDDGFVAYINGHEIARRMVAEPLTYSSGATGNHADSAALVFEDIDVTAHVDWLIAGENILAIQGLNYRTSSTDFVILPELKGSRLLPGGEQYFTTPTPRAVNLPGALGRVADTKFSMDRGFYDQPFLLMLNTDTQGAEIRFTTDGSIPTATTGIRYSGPITISRTTTVRAAAFLPGYLPTDVDSQTYIFLDQVIAQNGTGLPAYAAWGHAGADWAMDPDVVGTAQSPTPYTATIRDDLRAVPSINLSLPFADLFGANSQGIYIQGTAIERAASVEFIDPAGGEGFQINAAVEIQGGTSDDRWKVDKLSLQIIFKAPYGPTKLEYDVFGGGATERFDTLLLDASMNHSWLHSEQGQRDTAKYVQDQYVADLQQAMGYASVHGRYVHLYLGGLYWGMYYLHERPDESFASDYLGGEKEDYDIIKHRLSYTGNPVAGVKDNYQDLLNRVALNLAVESNYQSVLDVLDLDAFIDYMLLNFYVGNMDWAHQNWYASFNRMDADGKWRFHSWDAEHVLEGVSTNVTGRVDNTGGPTDIHKALLANPEYRVRFGDRAQKWMFNGGVLTPEVAAAMYLARVEEMDRAIVGESARWGDNRRALPYTQAEWRAFQDGLLASYFPQRTSAVLAQLRSAGIYPTIAAPTFSARGGSFDGPQTLVLSAATGTVYYTIDGTDPRLPGGGLSPSARRYAGPVTIDRSVNVRVRALSGTTWSALDEAVFHIGAPPLLRITELMYHPRGPAIDEDFPDEDDEYIEIQNLSGAAVDLAGVHFSEGLKFAFAAGTVIQPQQRLVIARNPAAFLLRYGDDLPVFGPFVGALDNNGERLTLATALGQEIQSFKYGDWYEITDGEGFSIVAIDPLAGDEALGREAGWRPSEASGGNPFEADHGENPGSIVINEVMSHGASGDWIELHNTTGHDIDIGGWGVSDTPLDRGRFLIPADTVVSAGGYLMLPLPDLFSRSGDEAYLTSMVAGQAGGYREKADFAGSAYDVSFGRHVKSTGAADFVALSRSTPGEPNAAPAIGPIIISELHYHPLTMPEFIELHNISADPVVLDGWEFTDGITFAFPAGYALAPGAYALIVPVDPAPFRSTLSIPASVHVFGPYTGGLSNAGEKLELSRPGVPDGAVTPMIVVDRVHFSDSGYWPDAPDGLGPTLQRIVAGHHANDPANWAASTQDNGTPGFGATTELGHPDDDWLLRVDPTGRFAGVYVNKSTEADRFIPVEATGIILSGRTITLDLAGGNPVAPGAALHADTLEIIGGTYVLSGLEQVNRLVIRSGACASASAQLTLASLEIDAAATLELGGQQLSLPESALAQVEGLLRLGRNGGDWRGAGISSDEAATAGRTLAAVRDGAGRVIVRAAMLGDTDLSGRVDGEDYFRMDRSFLGEAEACYEAGDLDYSGQIDGDDYYAMDQGYLGQSAVLPAGMPGDLKTHVEAGFLTEQAEVIRRLAMPVKITSVQSTPNPNALKFLLDRVVSEKPASFFSAESARQDPIASAIFTVPGVSNVLILGNFITVNKLPDATWPPIRRGVKAVLEKL